MDGKDCARVVFMLIEFAAKILRGTTLKQEAGANTLNKQIKQNFIHH